VTFVYQGEELGLEEGRLTLAEAQDPVALHEGDVAKGRDGCRTPMPWEPGPALGFTTAERAWTAFGGRSDADTMAVQRVAPTSMLHRYRELIAARRRHVAGNAAPLEWLDAPAGVVAYSRGALVVAATLGDEAVSFDLPDGEIVFLAGDASQGRLGQTAAVMILTSSGGATGA
jgi:alpha-glucosidase